MYLPRTVIWNVFQTIYSKKKRLLKNGPPAEIDFFYVSGNFEQEKNGYSVLSASQAPPPLKNGSLPKIYFFDVSDDFEQKNIKFFWYKNNFGLENF